MGEMIVSEGGSTALANSRAATDAAGVCREIVTKTAQTIQGRRYVRVEGWQAIANAFGCVASAGDVRRVDGGIAAVGQVRRVADGALIASAEGFVGDDEKTWAGRSEFARRAMAQTRAISRACRSAYAFIVVLMDAGLETTPAEEMSHDAGPVEYRPRMAPAADQAGKRSPVENARLAISRARTMVELDEIGRRIAERRDEGVFGPQAARELAGMVNERAEMLGFEAGGDHEAPEVER